ncbi:O-acetyl-ADP-ribose deacetylase [Pseudactinotalea sp. HY160]|uniref:O-acetyl-ADP-ribose deacetylase n=1 Tax=Pseudactinotalea sp. HY160 TaxID=2654490 RepID=UPI00128B5372|nr:O-acetyl-ADP-ribose deacetylase [Pseudactinotalea sp. HY160]MPV50239.1 O-acetyl-ADP-ribose deacetylase [Pseudactinotalea sp. HY160]
MTRTGSPGGAAAIEAVCGDLTRARVDAIVNAANSSLLGGGGVDGAVHRAAGPELLEHCRELRARYPGGFPVGEAAAIPGARLPATWVIQTVGPNWHRGERQDRLLAACFSNSLTEAVRVGARSVAFPAISAGVYGWDPVRVAKVAARAVRASDQLGRLDRVVFVLIDEPMRALFAAALA